MGTPPQIELGILGWTDSLLLMVLALVVFGPRRLPEIGRKVGKLMYEFRKASNDFKFQMEEELRATEELERFRKREAEKKREQELAESARLGEEKALTSGTADAATTTIESAPQI